MSDKNISVLASVDNETLFAEVKARAGRSPEFLQDAKAALTEHEVRPGVQVALSGGGASPSTAPEAAAEDPLALFKAQYEALPSGNILAQDSNWKIVQARLSDPKNADKLKKVLADMDEPRLYAVMEDGSLEFVDGNPDTPPMFVRNKATGEFQIIFKRDPKQMEAVSAQIEAGTHQWASIQEMLDWAKANGFEVFEADATGERWFGKEMKLAESASPNRLFVGEQGGPWMATALKDARSAGFNPGGGGVCVYFPFPGFRDDYLGLLRRLRI